MRACRQSDFSIKHKFDIVFSIPFRFSYFRKGVGLDVYRETQLQPRSMGIIFLAFDLHCYRSCHARIECHIIAEDVGMYMTHTVVECSLFAVLIVLESPYHTLWRDNLKSVYSSDDSSDPIRLQHVRARGKHAIRRPVLIQPLYTLP
jgi:hypothetical protein